MLLTQVTPWQNVSPLWDKWTRALSVSAGHLTAILGGDLATIYFIPLPWIGLLLWLAIAQNNLRNAAFGAVGLSTGHFVVRALRIADMPTIGGGIKANALLTGIAVAWLTSRVAIPVTTQILIACISATVAALITTALTRALTHRDRRGYRPYRAGSGCREDGGYGLPALALGYSLVAGGLFVLLPAWTSLAIGGTAPWPMPTDTLSWLQVFFRSLGSLLFSPTVETGVIVAGALLLWSRTLFVTGMVGWFSGAYAAIVIQGLGINYYWLPTSYNFFLSGMGLGAMFLLPGRMSLPIAAASGYGASILCAELQYIAPAWAYLPASAVLTIWIGLWALTIAEERTRLWRNYLHRLRPEDAWLRELYLAQRFGRREPLLIVPVAGAVQISQGFEDKLSHVGAWRYALDFQRPASFGDPTSIWDVPVFAPAPGAVARVYDGIVDNALGTCNYADNWGNYVLIHLDEGDWALLAHLRQHSIRTPPGARVDFGTVLATAGNSGRSPFPHVHLQVQRSPRLGAPTVPFRLANYESVGESCESQPTWHAMSVPAKNEIIKASLPNPLAHAKLASLAPGVAIWSLETKEKIPGPFRPHHRGQTIQINIQIDSAGRHIFTENNSGKMICGIDPDAWRILELSRSASPFLRLLALGAPTVPFAARARMIWQDVAPLNAVAPGWLGVSLAPYIRRPVHSVQSTCLLDATVPGDPIAIETTMLTPSRSLPTKIRSEFEMLRGPVKLEAQFQGGSVTYSLLSFEPGMVLA